MTNTGRSSAGRKRPRRWVFDGAAALPLVLFFQIAFVSTSSAQESNNTTISPFPMSSPVPTSTIAPTLANATGTAEPIDAGNSTRPPTDTPSKKPTIAPTSAPTDGPTAEATSSPTLAPTTPAPSEAPSTAPSEAPSELPTPAPSPAPTIKPTIAPSSTPTDSPAPTDPPTQVPSSSRIPSIAPTRTPTSSPKPTGPTPRPTGRFIVVPATPEPTRKITTEPSESPTGTPTTNHPTASPYPSMAPSSSVDPSASPSISFVPTDSAIPSLLPSESPSDLPSIVPTLSKVPTLSQQPSVSVEPTISVAPSERPSEQPSDVPSLSPTQSAAPSDSPSQFPSISPTLSQKPSIQPSVSVMPTISQSPSILPSEIPSATPSHNPTPIPTSPFPTSMPSESPSEMPSAIPTPMPSPTPTSMPTLSTTVYTQESITMIVEGFPKGGLDEEEIMEWENITSSFVLRFYQKDYQDTNIFPWNVTRVETTFKLQYVVGPVQPIEPDQQQEDADTERIDPSAEWLAIAYSQSIEVGLTEGGEGYPDIEVLLFSIPFQYQTFDYMLAFRIAWDLDTLPRMIAHEVLQPPPTTMPTDSPTVTPPEEGRNLSKRALRTISSCIVLSACLVVAFCFYDRHRKDQVLIRNISSRGGDERDMEFDNAGHPVDWRNPYSDEDGVVVNDVPAPAAASPQDPSKSAPVLSPQQQRQNPPGDHHRASSDTLAVLPNSPRSSSRNQHARQPSGSNLPPLPPRSNHSSSLRGIAVQPQSQSGQQHDRHVSVTDSVITDVTYGEERGYDDYDDGSEDIGPPILPTISSEDGYSTRSQEQNGPRSPLHIPDEYEETVDFANISPPPGPPAGEQGLLGLDGGSYTVPSMSGFNLQIQDLE